MLQVSSIIYIALDGQALQALLQNNADCVSEAQNNLVQLHNQYSHLQ